MFGEWEVYVKVVEIEVVVEEDGKIEGQAPPGTEPGKYKATLEVPNTPASEAAKRGPLNIPVIEVDYWPENFSTRREDLYDDDGR
jgi:hypothetical protein